MWTEGILHMIVFQGPLTKLASEPPVSIGSCFVLQCLFLKCMFAVSILLFFVPCASNITIGSGMQRIFGDSGVNT
jgi:hypothetical protein